MKWKEVKEESLNARWRVYVVLYKTFDQMSYLRHLKLPPSPIVWYTTTRHLTRKKSTILQLTSMDAVIEPSGDKIRVVSHRQYMGQDQLTPQTVLADPLDQFRQWFTEAQGKVHEPEAMSVSTATATGIPSSRFVLLKQVDELGFVFFTNYTSRKSRELEGNPNAALALYWAEMHRQVRVVGRVEKISREESGEYFKTRPLGSRIGAWASPQSQVVEDGEVSRRLKVIEEKFDVKNGSTEVDVPLPEFWGGWRVIPTYVVLKL